MVTNLVTNPVTGGTGGDEGLDLRYGKMGLAIMQDIASVVASRLRSLELDMIGLVQGNHR